MTVAGIDISNHQGRNVNFAQVKAAGYLFVIAKITEGTDFRDGCFDRNWSEMARFNLGRGCYHYALPSRNSAEAEADFFLRVIGNRLSEGDSVWLDFEDPSFHGNGSPWALAWLDRVEQAIGFAPGFYVYPAYIPERHLNDPALAAYPLWWASYSDPMRPTPAPWKTTAAWQFTSDGLVPGTTGRIDLNWFLGETIDGFLALGKPSGAAKTDDEKMQAYWLANAARLGPKKYAAMLSAHYYDGKVLVCANGVVTPDGETISGNVTDDWEGVQADNIHKL